MDLVRKLASASQADHLQGVQVLRTIADGDNQKAASIVCDMACELASASALSNRVQADRLRSALRCIKIDVQSIDLLVERAVAFSPALLNEIANALPPNHRRRLTRLSGQSHNEASTARALRQPRTDDANIGFIRVSNG